MKERKLTPEATPWFALGRDRIEHYHGLRQKTDIGVHAQIVNYVEKYIWTDRSKPLRVLDWGAGEGSLSLRLHHMGVDVTSADMDHTAFQAEGPEFYRINFNNSQEVDEFVKTQKGKYDLVIATEVIEHIHDPWLFLERLHQICDQDTHVIITTPNVSNWWSRVWFFLTGDLWSFTRQSWVDPGHINPFTDTRFEGVTSDTGFEIVARAAAGCLPRIWFYSFKILIASFLALPFRLVQRGRIDGWATLYHLQKGK